VIQGGVLVFAMVVVLINLMMDLVYVVVDPRVKVQ
jgi:ABC-type dipeptide/oligopeptide/nickel transport system permease component